MRSLAIDPLNDDVVYAGTEGGGVFKTVDGGQTWSKVSAGLATRFAVTGLAVDPTNSQIVYAGATWIYKSTNGGASWVNTGSPILGTINAFYIDPANTDTVYASTSSGLYKSDSGGAWTLHTIGPQISFRTIFAIDPAAPSTIYLGSTLGVHKSTDGGATWTESNTGLGLTARRVNWLVIDPSNPSILLAATEGGTYRSTNAGAAWTFSAGAAMSAVVFDPINPANVYTASTSSGLLYASTDGGGAWTLRNAGITAARIESLAVGKREGTLYAGVRDSGVFKSPDRGLNWIGVMNGLTAVNVIALSIADQTPTGVLIGTNGGGIFRRAASGASGAGWSTSNTGLPGKDIRSLAIDPNNPNIMYAVSGSLLCPCGLFKSTNGGLSWSQSVSGLTNITNERAVAIDPLFPSTVYVATSSGVFKSTNSGDSWASSSVGLTDLGIYAIAIDPVNSANVYAAAFGGVFKSTDYGANWVLSRASNLSTGSVFAIDPLNPSIVYVVGSVGNFKTTDAGATWSQFVPFFGDSPSLAIDPVNPANLYVATVSTSGVSRSTNSGATWTNSVAGLEGNQVRSLAVDPANGSRVYAGTNAGVYRSDDSGVTWRPDRTIPSISWLAPSPVTFGVTLSDTQLNATADLAGAFVYSPPVGTVLGAGDHVLSVSFVPTDLENYTTSAKTVNLTVNPAIPTVTVGGDFNYTGAPHHAVSSVQGLDGANVAGSVAFNYSPGGSSAPVNAGTYLVTAAFTSADPNYTDAVGTGLLTIQPSAASLMVGGSFIYDATPHLAIGTATGANGLSVAGMFTFAYPSGGGGPPVNAGIHLVNATFVSADSNYLDGIANGAITIAPAMPTISVTGGTFAYDTQGHSATATATGINGVPVPGTFTFSYAPGGATLPVNAGTYTVSAVFTSADPNFSNAAGVGSVIITRAAPVVAVTGGTFIYSGAAHPATATASGLGGAAVPGSFVFTYTPGGLIAPVNVGTYSVTANFLSSDPNYTNASDTTSLTILPATGGQAAVSNGTFDTNAVGWILGGGCGDSRWVGGIGNPPGSVQLNACGESGSNPTARQTVSGFVPGQTYAISVDVRVHVSLGANGRSFGLFVDNEPGNPILLGEFVDGSWHRVTASFVALSPTHTIIIAGELDARTPGVPSSSDVSYYIDNVSVQSGSGGVVVEWRAPAPITYGTSLSSAQLNATATVNGADVPGTFEYSPAAGTVLAAGNHDLSVTFTPDDLVRHTPVTASVSLAVTKATPAVQVMGGTFVYDGLPHAATATVTGPMGAVPGTTALIYLPGGASPPILIGNYTVAARFTSSDPNFADTTSAGSIAIVPVSPFATVTITTEQPAFRRGQPVQVSGQVLSADGSGIPNVPVSLRVSGSNLNRSATPFSDAQGRYHYTFQPSATDGGQFNATATTTIGGVTQTASSQFRLIGLIATPATTASDLVMGTDLAVALSLRNVGDQALDNGIVTVTVLPSGAVTVAGWSTLASIPAGATVSLPVIVTAPQGTPPSTPVNVSIRIATTDSASGVTSDETVTMALTLRPAIRIPVVQPAGLSVGVNPGRSITRRFVVRNDGFLTMAGAYVALRDPSATPWVSLGNSSLGDLLPGEFREIAMVISPPSDLAFGTYSVPFDVFGGDSPVAATVHITVTASTIGEATVVVNNDLGMRVPGATVTLYGVTSGRSFQGMTAADGTVSIPGVDAGAYSYVVSADSHSSGSGNVAVAANTTTPVAVLLSYDVVTLTFSVTPTTIVDQYNVTLNVTYSTTLPKPALQVVPYNLQLRFFPEDAPGGRYACRLSVTNSHPTAGVRNVTVDASQLDVQRPFGQRLRIVFSDGSSVWDAGALAAQATTLVPCFAVLDGGSVESHGAGNILVQATYDFSLDGQALEGTTTTKVPVSYLRPDELSYDPIAFTYDKRTDPANPVLRYEDGSFLRTVRSNRAPTIDFLRPTQPFNGRNIVAFTDTVGGASSSAVIQANASRVFWRGDFNAAKQSLTGVGDTTTFDFSTLDAPGGGGVSLEDALRAQIAIDEVQVTTRPTYLGFAGQWSDGTTPSTYLLPVLITTVLPDQILIPRPAVGPTTGCLNPEDDFCEDPTDELRPPVFAATDGVIRLAIEQKVRLERQAFDALLRIGTTAMLTNATAAIQVTDAQGQDASSQFFTIVTADPAGATHGGTLTGQAAVAWQLIPRADAGGTLPGGAQYDVQVLFSYAVSGVARTAATHRVRITVLPSPKLRLHYTLPFVVVPGKQVKVRVQVENIGSGPAQALSIESAQPRILESIPAGGVNPLFDVIGPLVNFTFTGSSNTFDGSTFAAGNLNVNFGEVASAAIVNGYWELDVSRRGFFIDVRSTMTQQDYRGVRLDALVLPPTTALVPAVGGTISGGTANVGLPALTVRLLQSGAVVGTDTTDGAGAYYIADLQGGVYDMEVVDLAGTALVSRTITVLGDQATDFIDIELANYDPTLAVVVVRSTTPGASFTADGETFTTPHSFVWEIGSEHALQAASSASGDNLFVGWSDAETLADRIVTVGTTGVVLEAEYRPAAEVNQFVRTQITGVSAAEAMNVGISAVADALSPSTNEAFDHKWPAINNLGDIVWSQKDSRGYWQVYKRPASGGSATAITNDDHNHERPTIADDGTIGWFQDRTGSGAGLAIMRLDPSSETPSLVEFSSQNRFCPTMLIPPFFVIPSGPCTQKQRTAGETFGMANGGKMITYYTYIDSENPPPYRRFNVTDVGSLLDASGKLGDFYGLQSPDINDDAKIAYVDSSTRTAYLATVTDPLNRQRIAAGQYPHISDGVQPDVVVIQDGGNVVHAPELDVTRWVAKGRWADVVRTESDTTIVYECVKGGVSQICVAKPKQWLTLTKPSDSGDDQLGAILTTLPLPLTVEVRDSAGRPVEGVPILFEVTLEPPGTQTHATLSTASSPTNRDGLASTDLTLGDMAGEYRVAASCGSGRSCVPQNVVLVEHATSRLLSLRQLGKTTINRRNKYSEDTDLLASVTFAPGHPRAGEVDETFNGPITFGERLNTVYYDGCNSATPPTWTVVAAQGTAKCTLSSLSDFDEIDGPPDAHISAHADGVLANTDDNPYFVDQWVKNRDGNYEWLMEMVSDILQAARAGGGELAATVRAVNAFDQLHDVGYCGEADGSTIFISPVCNAKHRRNDDNVLSDTVLHEARHAWQNAQSQLNGRRYGVDDDGDRNTPSNDDDGDGLVEWVALATPGFSFNFIQERFAIGGSGNDLFSDKQTPGTCSEPPPQVPTVPLCAQEADAELFAAWYKRRVP